MDFALDCKYFKGDSPCKFYKEKGYLCKCVEYEPIQTKILIIKLGAVGDVIRTTPILRKLKEEYPKSEITWITKTPNFLPDIVNHKLAYTLENITSLQAQEFDILFNFDKEKESCALTNSIKAKTKKGFMLKQGKAFPIDADSEYKYKMGLNNEFNLKTTESYPEQVFMIAGYKFNKEKYVFDTHHFKGKKLIGLNTGCSSRWKTRLWPKKRWIALAKELRKKGYNVLLLGGELEHGENKMIAEASGALYLGYHSLETFVALISFCDLIVTSVTMALHIAIACEKKVVLFNNVFNKYEFELYELGKIIQPPVECLGCYKEECNKECMDLITEDKVLETIEEVLRR